jgi:hypothetical protein
VTLCAEGSSIARPPHRYTPAASITTHGQTVNVVRLVMSGTNLSHIDAKTF